MNKADLYQIIADQIGVEAEDLNESDSLRDDLHMSSVDLAEVAQKIEDVTHESIDFSDIELIEELLESLNIED